MAGRLSTVLLALMLTQALMRLAVRAAYRDVEWIRTTWFGNDWVTLVVAAPLLGTTGRALINKRQGNPSNRKY